MSHFPQIEVGVSARDPAGRRFAGLGFFLALPLVLALAGCGNLLTDDCSLAKQAAKPGGGLACASARSERTVLFSGDDFPRLWTGEAGRSAPNVHAAALDRPPPPSPPAVGYFGSTLADYPDDRQAEATDIEQIRDAGGRNFNPEDKVSIDFNRASIDYVLRQLLGGALGVNYVAPDKLGGSVTFRTEKPLPKRQVLEVVRDILGRNGLGMIYLNGVYQIGSADALKEIQAADQLGVDRTTRIVPVRKGSAQDVAALARQLAPPGVAMTATAANDAVLIRASAADIGTASEMIRTLVDDGVGQDKMAIIRLHQAPPDLVANQVEAFYQGRLGKQEDLTLIPLGPQQALLVGTHDMRLLASLRTLVRQLDRATPGDSAVRIIQLTYLSAADIAPQLSSIFGGQATIGESGSGPSFVTRNPSGAGASPFGGLANGGGPSLPTLPSSGASSVQGTSRLEASAGEPNPNNGASAAAGPSGRSAVAASTPAPSLGAQDAGIKFVADTRNNAIMVYSSYEIYQRVRNVLKAIDVPQAQVVIEATIADVTLNDQLQYGVQWFLNARGFTIRSSQSTDTTDPGSAGGFASIGASVGDVSARVLLNALQSITTVKVISSPYLTVVDGKEARLVIGDQIPYTTTTQNSTSNGVSTITNAITTLDTGVILDVVPKILSNNTVDLAIDQEVTQPVVGTAGANNDPTIDTRSVKSDVLAESGRTIVLGGMIQESSNRTENGTPVAQALPFVGNLFKSKQDAGQRTELLVLITPRVVRQSAQLENITRLLRDQLHVN